MDAMQNLLTRRSVRQYKEDPIPQDVLERIVEAGTYAATGMGKQSPIIVAVTNRALRDRLSRMNAAVMGGSGDPFYGAPVVLVDGAKRIQRRAPQNLYLDASDAVLREAESLFGKDNVKYL